MKDTHVKLRALTASLLIMLVPAVHAGAGDSDAAQAWPSTKAGQTQRVQILPDQARGEVKFIIDGQPVLRVTSDSIIVSGSVIYSGVVQDTGTGN